MDGDTVGGRGYGHPRAADSETATRRGVPAGNAAKAGTAHPEAGSRLLLVRDGRAVLEVSLKPLVGVLLAVSLLVPASAGALLRLSRGAEVQPFSLVLQEHLSELAARHVPFLVVPAAPPPPPPPPPPPVPDIEPPTEPATPEARRGHLRVYSLHLKEAIDVVPFDDEGRPIPEAFAQIQNLWRCRITGHEVRVHPRLVRILVTINDLYDKPLQLISGHRVPHTIGTSPTSQHTVGNAADVRVAGVSTEELRALAKQLGGRGVGLYSEQRFVHIDFRPGHRYFWTDESDSGSEGSEGVAAAPAPETPGQLASAQGAAGSQRSGG